MSSWVWYNHFQGAAYPLNLGACRQHVQYSKEMKTLVQIASAYIVQDSSMTEQALLVLPQNLCASLLEQAIERDKDRAIYVLLSQWPERALSLRKMASPLYDSLRTLYDQKALTSTVIKGVRFTTSLAHNFMETLKKKTDTKLKYLDLSGFPTAETIVFYLATHCMLVHNEARQKVMIRNYKAAIERLSEFEVAEQRCFTEDQTLPDGTFTVKLDVFVTSDKTLFELCKALKVSSFETSRLKLIVETLDVTCLGQSRILLLLELLEVQHLLGLRLKYNSIDPQQFRELAPHIHRFTNLKSLDLSCNSINPFLSWETCTVLSNLLGALPNLTRLDLSNNRLKTRLRQILSNIVQPLQYLRLVGCGLTEGDLEFLSQSNHAESLQELYLSENCLGRSISVVIRLLRAIRQTLRILEMEDVSLSESHIQSLLSSAVLTELTKVMFINLSANRLSEAGASEVCRQVCRIPPLQYLWISFPIDCHQQMTEEEVEQASKVFLNNVTSEIQKEREKLYLTHVIPFLVLTPLASDMVNNL